MTTTTDTVCSSQLTYNLTGNFAQNANDLLWTRVNPIGTGTFSSSTTLNPVYTFNAADITNGFVILGLSATSNSNCSLTDYKEIRINITKAPTVVTAPIGSVCQGSVFTASATATDISNVLWSTVGTSNGLFANANQLVTQYSPGTNDINSFTIQVTASGYAPCAFVSATKIVTIQQKPTIDAGIENRYNCSGQPYQITGVTGQNLGAVSWASNSGAPGIFSDPTALNPSYTPSASELTSGNPIILTMIAQAVAPCIGSDTDFIILNLDPKQVVNSGIDQTVCELSTVTIAGSALNTSSVFWTSSSSGSSGFANPNSLSTTYQPSAVDIINGTVTLILHAISDSNCPEVTDSTVITILKKPTANAGLNITICEGSSYTLSAGEASAQNYSAITWSATGPGTLDSSTINSLTPTYKVLNRQCTKNKQKILEEHNQKLEKKKKEKQNKIDERIKYLENIDLSEWGALTNIANKWKIASSNVKKFIVKYYPQGIEKIKISELIIKVNCRHTHTGCRHTLPLIYS